MAELVAATGDGRPVKILAFALGLFDQSDDGLPGPAGTAKDGFIGDAGGLDSAAVGAEVIGGGRDKRLLLAGEGVVRKIGAATVQVAQFFDDTRFVPDHVHGPKSVKLLCLMESLNDESGHCRLSHEAFEAMIQRRDGSIGNPARGNHQSGQTGGDFERKALNRIKRLLPKGVKVGHAGTLDPFATGVLLVLMGKATKRCEQLMGEPKTYEATVRLGATTPTDDLKSQATAWSGAREVARERVDEAVAGFVGELRQRPPAFSAMKVGGRRAYKLARAGAKVELEQRLVRVHRIDVLRYEWPELVLRIECGRGTYIRSIARDLGEVLDVGGHLTALRRTRVGAYDVERAVTLERLAHDGVAARLQA